MEEVEVLKNLKNLNVVRLYCAISRESSGGILNTVSIVMEKCNGTLSDLISVHKCYDLKTVSYLFKQIVKALIYIHGENILHRYNYIFITVKSKLITPHHPF